MPWIILILSGIFEAIWATALGMSNGLREPVPTTVFVVASIISLYGLGRAMKHITMGTAYAVWVGVGGSLTVVHAMATGVEPVSLGKVIFLSGIILAVIGLKLVPDNAEEPPADAEVAIPS